MAVNNDFNLNENGISDFGELSERVNQSNDGEVIYLESDYRTTNSSNQIIISKSITIDGQNHVIEAPDVIRVFLVEADNVCLKNINFINSQSTDLAGGAISWLGNNGTLSNCNFTNNSASSGGGAVCWMGDFGTITNCTFNSNNVVYGPAVSLTSGESFDPTKIHIQIVNSDGGAIYAGGNNIVIDYCNFYKNSAWLSGGAISTNYRGNVSISNCKFKNNIAGYHGGAIDFNCENANLSNSKFYNNSPNDLFVNTNNLTIANSTFKRQSCIESWYGITYKNVSYGIYNFDDLKEVISEIPEGGVLVLDCDYEFVNGSDKGIVISKSITIDGAGHTLDGKKLSRIFNVTADNVTIKNINFINGNSFGSYGACYGGGAIYWKGANGLCENCSFEDNSLYSFEYDPYTEDNQFRPNGATTGQGGAITWIGANGKVSNSTFRHNSVGYANNGGAIFWAGVNGQIMNSEFYDNDAYRGSAIYWSGANGTITLSKFINDGICDSGIFWVGKNGVVKNSILLKSRNGEDVISPYSVSVKADFNFWGDTVDNPNKVNKNKNVNYWVLLEYSPDKDFVFEGENFTVNYNFNNLMSKSGTLYGYRGLNSKAGSVVLTSNETGLLNVSFDNGFKVDIIPYNSTGDFYDLLIKIHDTPEGGILVLDKDYEFITGFNKGIVISKSITIDGAGHTLNGNKLSRIFNITADNVTIKNVNFINGNAIGQYFTNKNIGGGAIYWYGSNGFVENCNFTDNAGRSIDNSPFEKEEVVIDENGMIFYIMRMMPMGAKTNEGGAIVWSGTNGCVSKCIFTRNSIGYANPGGAICWRGDFGNIINSEFYENSAWCGAAIAVMGDNVTILSSIIANNSFFDEGIYWFGNNGTVKNSILVGTSLYGSVLRSYTDVVADYNFWGDTLENPNKEFKFDGVNNWLVMNFTHNGEFINKGEEIVIDYDIVNLIDKNGSLSKYDGLIDRSGQLKYTATKSGFLNISFINGKINVDIDSKDKIKSSDLVKYYSATTSFKVSVSDMYGKVVGKYVYFTINGKTHKVKTDKKGVATLKLKLKPGKYTITSKYGKAIVKNKITVKSTLITKNVKVKSNGKFTAKVLNSKGKPFAKKVVKFKFKGKTYKIKTNNKGIATFKLPENLKAGKYTIKTTYNGLTNTNKIVVRK